MEKFVIISGTAHPELSADIGKYLNLELGAVDIKKFPDQELDVKINSDVRGADVFVVQPTCTPGNENLMELLILIDCLKRASAERITAVIPYYGYARKDRKDAGRVPITAKLVANLITTAGAHRVLTIDLHAEQIQGFFDIPVDHLLAWVAFIPYFSSLQIENLVVVSPDVGSIKQARAYAKKLGGDLAVIDKRRESATCIESIQLIGDVQGKNVLIVDDMISTGNSIVEACKLVKKNGAKDVYLCATHAVLCPGSIELLNQSGAKQVVVSNTIPIGPQKNIANLKIISMASYLGEAISRIHKSESVSELFGRII
ncbi:MAG: ribose-phosphate pyrophosphokinase [Candidatus Brocadiae bacterium]|nr:ribose-phosphate pyrophosphokinase [Candidatus Brocadiia bacterium]